MMDSQEILKQIVHDPLNETLWSQYGDITKESQNWKACVSAYLASLRLVATEGNMDRYIHSLESYIKSLKTREFSMRILKLPKQTIVIDMYGILNMNVNELEEAVKRLLLKKDILIFMHFHFLVNLTGLGPSTIKKIIKWCKEKDVFVAAVAIPETVIGTFELKKIEIQKYSNMLDAFCAK